MGGHFQPLPGATERSDPFLPGACSAPSGEFGAVAPALTAFNGSG